MPFYTEDLYKKVIQEPAEYFNQLKVISGYASAKFLRRVVCDFPNHQITLIVGMAPQGISIRNHEEFKNICKSFSNVRVYYQTETPSNHMKIYQWYLNEDPKVSFIGSANFSETGFFEQNEILSPMIDIFSTLIDEVLSHSIFCLHEQVLNKIPLYEDEKFKTLGSEGSLNEKDIKVLNNYSSSDVKSKQDYTHNCNKVNLKKMLLSNLHLTSYNHVTVELMLKDDPHWQSKSLNVWTRPYKIKDNSYIDIGRTNNFGGRKLDFFPRNVNFQLISDDNIQWIVKRVGEYGKELMVIEGINFYEYFLYRLGIKEGRAISYNDFYNYGRANVDFYKLSDDQYLLDFSLG